MPLLRRRAADVQRFDRVRCIIHRESNARVLLFIPREVNDAIYEYHKNRGCVVEGPRARPQAVDLGAH